MKNFIKQIRETRKMSQRECANELNISLRAWQTYEQGVSEPKQELLCKIADMFNVSLDHLLGRETDESEPVEQLAKRFNLSVPERDALNNYLSLPDSVRRDFVKIFKQIIHKV